MPKPKHILVIRLSAMGDVAMTIPVLTAFTQQYPEVKLTVLTKSFFKPMFRDLQNVSVFEADLKGKHNGVLGLWKLSKSLKKLEFDAVADLHNVLRSNILNLFLIGKKIVQIDKGRAEKKALVKGQNFKQLKTSYQRYADVFEQLGYKINLSNPTFPKRKPLSSTRIPIRGDHSKKWVGIAPIAAFKGKTYPIEVMQKVIATLAKDYKVLLFGGESEKATLQHIANHNDNIINLAAQLNFNEELDVISNLDLMISMDSGNAHLAAMLGIKVLTIWGVTHPYAGFYPFYQDADNALLADRDTFPKIPTSIYGNSLPKGYENVFSTISPEAVVSKVNDLLN